MRQLVQNWIENRIAIPHIDSLVSECRVRRTEYIVQSTEYSVSSLQTF
jgi:hypothetical protein